MCVCTGVCAFLNGAESFLYSRRLNLEGGLVEGEDSLNVNPLNKGKINICSFEVRV